MNHPHHLNKSASTDSLQDSLLPAGKETEAEIVFSPQTKKSETGPSAKIGQADLGGPGHPVGDVEEEGMIMGPSHPIFARDQQQQSTPSHPFYPDLQVPPGARFDPISPVGPGFYSPGDPDFDELLPPGPGSNTLGSTIKPPRKPKGPPSSSSGSYGGHPFGAPPGPGNPPFFM